MKASKFSVKKELQHRGICDASGAVALDEDHFVVANDEDNILRVYRSDISGSSVSEIGNTDINKYFINNPKHKETDIEGAAQIGDIIYWITSHGTNKEGKSKPERRQFFANKVLTSHGSRSFQQVGYSYTQLVEDMLKDERLHHYRLDKAAKVPPKQKEGLNIEGLAATPNQEILIGFRNPIPQDKAILLTLKNPKDLIEKSVHAIFGDPIELDLNGLGIRSIEYWRSQGCFIIIAGAYDGSDQFSLYQWSGLEVENPQPIEITGLPSDFRPESVLFYPNQNSQFQLLSDDGSIERIAGTPCKEIDDEDSIHKYFRSLWIKIEDDETK
ncbi:MAG: DUF3616 domain-containing protein [Thermosynechococcaceae cyanobacterium MS004]|nr:DUF3616 domain-containing protein [Thermosynechococcaceae cyanobacterium MS004]